MIGYLTDFLWDQGKIILLRGDAWLLCDLENKMEIIGFR